MAASDTHPIDYKLAFYAPTVKQPTLRFINSKSELQYAGVRERTFLQFSAYGKAEETFPFSWLCPDHKCCWDQSLLLQAVSGNGKELWFTRPTAFATEGSDLSKARQQRRGVIDNHNKEHHQGEVIVSDPGQAKSVIDG